MAFAGASLPAASAAAIELGLPLQVIPQTISGTESQKFTLPKNTFALIGTPSELTLKSLEKYIGYRAKELLHTFTQNLDDELVIVSNKPSSILQNGEDYEVNPTELNRAMSESLLAIEEIYNKIKSNPKLKDHPVKLLGIGIEGQVLAGQLGHLLNKNGCPIGIAAVDNYSNLQANSVVYTSKSGDEILSVDRNSLGMGDLCIAVAKNFTKESKKAINNLASIAKIHCPYYLSLSNQCQCDVSMEEEDERTSAQGFYTANSGLLLFSQKGLHQETTEQRNLQFLSCS